MTSDENIQDEGAKADQHRELFGDEGERAEFFEQLAASAISEEAAEELRLEYCETCSNTRGQQPGARLLLCQFSRCGLRTSADLNSERDWAQRTLQALVPAGRASSQEVEKFNRYLTDIGCVSVALVRYPSGRWGSGYQATTLRAAIHLAVFLTVTARAWRQLRRMAEAAR